MVKKNDYYVFGKPIFAPAAGKVIDVLNTIPDNKFIGKTIKYPELPNEIDPNGMGNHVVIDHGFSGDAIFPHLHYAFMNGSKDLFSEGLPSYFYNYKWYNGKRVFFLNEEE